MHRFAPVALVAGVGFFALGLFGLSLAPFLAQGSTLRRAALPPGVDRPPASLAAVFPDRAAHMEALRRGRDLYVREACWHCHSQFVRPFPEETARYGPVSTQAEYEHDLQLPQLFGTRRVGPDLIREAGKRTDDWHLAHLWRPRSTVSDSVMPAYPWWFREVPVEAELAAGGWRLRPGPWRDLLPEDPAVPFPVTPGEDGVAFAGRARGTPVPVFPGEEAPPGTVRAFRLVLPTRDAWSVVAYLQSLGRHLARPADASAARAAATGPVPFGPGDADRGAVPYTRHCASCHGAAGDGRGPAAPFLDPRPRDFTRGTFKLQTSPPEQAPLDSDLFATITAGMPGTSMPSWRDLPEQERWDLAAFVARLADGGRPRDPSRAAAQVPVPPETPDDAGSRERGRRGFDALCAACHGQDGRGSAFSKGTEPLADSAGHPLRSRDLTDPGGFRGGSVGEDLYRRLVVGIPGSPMPAVDPPKGEVTLWDIVHLVRSLAPPAAK